VAQPILKQWMDEQIGWRGLVRQIRKEGVLWSSTIPQLPRLIHRTLENSPSERLASIEAAINRVNNTQRWQSVLIASLVGLFALVAVAYVYLLLFWGS
jgi:ubiquinone biosynthesis protein